MLPYLSTYRLTTEFILEYLYLTYDINASSSNSGKGESVRRSFQSH